MKNPYPTTRRLSVLRVTPDLIVSICQGRYEVAREFLTESATILQTTIDEYDNCIEILVEHAGFNEVGPGCEVPEVPPIHVNRITWEDLGNQLTESAVVTLNDALDVDPACVGALMCVRRACSEAMADHPNIIVRQRTGTDILTFAPTYSLGFLGLLNGIVTAAGSKKRVAAVVDDDNNQNILRFEARDESEFKE